MTEYARDEPRGITRDELLPCDAVDAEGRRYLEVPVYPDGELKQAFSRDVSACVECGSSLTHGTTRYFQRNEAADGQQDMSLQALLLALTFDYVCGECGDKLIKASAA